MRTSNDVLIHRLFDELNGYPLQKDKLLPSELIVALHSEQLEIANLARIVATRRGIQIVDV